MARATLKCTKCDRKFSMPAHLARHMKSIHATGGRRSNNPAPSGRGPGRPKGSKNRVGLPLAATMSAIGSGDIVHQLETYRQDLVHRRTQIDQALEGITTALKAFDGSMTAKRPVGRPRGGSPRSGSLKTYIIDALQQAAKPMSPREISAAAIKAGYPTKSDDLTKAVSNALPQINQARRIGFGMYEM